MQWTPKKVQSDEHLESKSVIFSFLPNATTTCWKPCPRPIGIRKGREQVKDRKTTTLFKHTAAAVENYWNVIVVGHFQPFFRGTRFIHSRKATDLIYFDISPCFHTLVDDPYDLTRSYINKKHQDTDTNADHLSFNHTTNMALTKRLKSHFSHEYQCFLIAHGLIINLQTKCGKSYRHLS